MKDPGEAATSRGLADCEGVDVGNGTQTWTCARCGKRCERKAVRGQRPKWCSDQCGWIARAGNAGTCACCGAEYEGFGGKYCSIQCSNAMPRKRPTKKPKAEKVAPIDRRSPLRRAIESGDGAGVLVALMSRGKRNLDGCIEWQGRFKDGYPVVVVANRGRYVHRLVVEASTGAPLGSQQAHHMCANTRCINPDHLQPVTHRDNSAEMMARQSYIARIRELEDALALLDPYHPLLLVLPVA